jgi:predicted GH43/DUF377 family glycosyl hydrolase
MELLPRLRTTGTPLRRLRMPQVQGSWDAIDGTPPAPTVPPTDTSPRLFVRSGANPILTARDLPYAVNSVFNPAAAQVGAETVLLARAERFTGQSHLVVARSADGVTGWRFDHDQGLVPDPANHPEDLYGIEDARITAVPEFGYLVTFTSYSAQGPVVSLAATRDFHSYERMGVIAGADDKDAAILPRRFGGQWLLIHRPVRDPQGPAHIRFSRSPDLRTWTDGGILLPAREGGWWDARKVGMGPPPLETEAGWLMIYHAVRTTGSGCLYRNGLALLDRDDPTRVIARSDEFVLGPEALYERTGDVPNVVFPEGWILEADGRTLRIYYGAADSSVCLATAELPELLAYLRRYPVAA